MWSSTDTETDLDSSIVTWLAAVCDPPVDTAQEFAFPEPDAVQTPPISHSLVDSYRARKRTMNNDTISDTSRETGRTSAMSVLNRRILEPIPPSSKKRGSNPARLVLNELLDATPYLLVCQPDREVQQPSRVIQLRESIMKTLSDGFIPPSLKSKLEAIDPDQFSSLPSQHLFEEESVLPTTAEADLLWERVKQIHQSARSRCNERADENAWIHVVNDILNATDLRDPSSMLHVHSIQSQAIDPLFLPRHSSQSFAKKVDLAIGFSTQHKDVLEVTKAVKKANPEITFSQMTDGLTRRIPLVCCVAVKEMGGDYNEALLQLALWCAAGLERVCTLKKDRIGDVPPLVGWTVVGHDWKLHIAWKDEDGNVVILGPWEWMNAGTRSHAGILMLIAILRTVKSWYETEYWSWLSTTVLGDLMEDQNT